MFLILEILWKWKKAVLHICVICALKEISWSKTTPAFLTVLLEANVIFQKYWKLNSSPIKKVNSFCTWYTIKRYLTYSCLITNRIFDILQRYLKQNQQLNVEKKLKECKTKLNLCFKKYLATVSTNQKWSKEGLPVNQWQGHRRPMLIDWRREQRLAHVVQY